MHGLNANVALVPIRSLAEVEQEARNESQRKQNKPVIQSLAAHVKKRWELAKDARTSAELRLTDNLRRRRGEYDPAKLAEIREFGGSTLYLGITSVKCRAAAAWLRETLMGTGVDRPWELEHTPLPDLPPDLEQNLQGHMQQQLMAMYQQGVFPDQQQLIQAAKNIKEHALKEAHEEAKKRIDRMATKIEDQLVEGGWINAFGQFVDDLVTFPTAIIKGPVVRQRKQMQWTEEGLVPVEGMLLEWERVDPFMFYPAPWASNTQDGFVIERHRLTREDLQSMMGVDGYDEDAIKAILIDYEAGGLREWLWVDAAQAEAEGKSQEAHRPSDLIDAIQLWDSIEGRMLVEWGVPEEEIEDLFKAYPCEVWLIGGTVIRAVLNYDPMGRKPYFSTSYEKIPGAFWGNSLVDLIKDPQDMANAAARALANNMGIASGPQVVVNVSRLPPDEDITSLYPWKVWQTAYNDFTDSSRPIDFFQPNSNASELLTVLEKFTNLADEYSGIPKYMTGEHVAGAGRTSSGLAMLVNNAAKSLKQVVSSIDHDVINPMLERIYQHNLRYNQDPDMIGDVKVIARGAMSLVSREAAAVRRNEFLQIVLTSPLAQQIVGLPGAAELLRENARLLDVNVDKLVPSHEDLVAQMHQQQLMQQQMMMAQQGGGHGQPQTGAPTLPDGSRVGGRDSNTQSPRPNMK